MRMCRIWKTNCTFSTSFTVVNRYICRVAYSIAKWSFLPHRLTKSQLQVPDPGRVCQVIWLYYRNIEMVIRFELCVQYTSGLRQAAQPTLPGRLLAIAERHPWTACRWFPFCNWLFCGNLQPLDSTPYHFKTGFATCRYISSWIVHERCSLVF